MKQRNPNPTISGAIFGPLDARTRARFGLDRAGAAPAATAETGHSGGPTRPHGVCDGEAPRTPLQFRAGDIAQIARRTLAQVAEDRVTAVAGGVTFFALLSLFPAITAFVSIYGLFNKPETIAQHLEMMQHLLPSGALDIIRGQIQSIAASPSSVLSLAGMIALVVAFYSANGGTKALLDALNVANFERETRGLIKLNLVAMCFTLGALVVMSLVLGVVAILPAIIGFLPLPAPTENLLSLVRWPILFAVLILCLAALYRWGPAKPGSRWRWISPGAVFASVAFVVTSMLFSWYAANLAHYNETYGSLGAVIALMIWLWLSVTIVLVGAELNAEIERQLRMRNGLDVPGDPGADEAGRR
jgi:membrane protein